MVVHCVLIQAHTAGMGGAVPRLLGPAPWGTKGPEQATQEGGSEQPQRSHGHRYLGGAEQKMKVRTPEPRFFQDLTLCTPGKPNEGARLGREYNELGLRPALPLDHRMTLGSPGPHH